MAQHRIKEGLDLMMELSMDMLNDTEEAKWVPWYGETMFAVLPLYGRDALPLLETIEKWPVLQGRGKQLAEKLPELRKRIEHGPKEKLVSLK